MTNNLSNGITIEDLIKENQKLRDRLFKVEAYLNQVIHKTIENRKKEAEKANNTKNYPWKPWAEADYRIYMADKTKAKKRGIDFIKNHYNEFLKTL